MINNKRVYINATHPTIELQYITMLTLYLLAPLGLLYMLFLLFKISDYTVNSLVVILAVLIGSAIVGLYIFFIYQRQNWVFKIVTDNKGITYYGLLKKIFSNWDEINSMEVISTMFNMERVRVTTNKGVFTFPPTMKEKSAEYPKLTLGNRWKDQMGNEKSTDARHCPLYIEMQEKLNVTL